MHDCAKVAYVATDDCQPCGSLRENYRGVTSNCAPFHATRDIQTEVKLAVRELERGAGGGASAHFAQQFARGVTIA